MTALTLLPSTDLAAVDAASHPALVYLASLASGSQRTMRQALNTIAALLGAPERLDVDGRDARFVAVPWHLLRYQHTAAIRSKLAEQFAPATANKMLAALRGTLREAQRLGLMRAEDYARAVDVRGIKAERLPRGLALSGGEIAALMDACLADDTPAGARDAALLALMRVCGPRRAEVASLALADYTAETGSLVIRHAKGNKQRIVYVEDGNARDALADWIAVRGSAPGPLFVPIDKAGRAELRQLTTQGVFVILDKRRVEAGVAPFTPHDLRRTFISDLLDAGADIVVAQKLAGHAQVETTARYDRRGEVAKRKAAALLHVPYRKRENHA